MNKNEKFFIPLKTVKRFTVLRRGLELAVDGELARFEFIREDLLRIKISGGGKFDTSPTFAVICDEFGDIEFTYSDNEQFIVLQSSKITALINKNDFSWQLKRADGTLIYATVPGETYKFLNDAFQVRKYSQANDFYYGFGERSGGLNQNGRHITMWNNDIYGHNASNDPALRIDDQPPVPMHTDKFDPYYISIPLYYRLTSDGAASGSFVDNTFRMKYDLRDENKIEIFAEGGNFTEYVFAGASIQAILKNYHDLTGYPPALPLWAYGHHQCRWHEYSAETLQNLGKEYRKRNIPCDTLWMDIDYMNEYRVFTWNYNLFPNPSGTIENLKKEGFRAITIIDPGVKYDPGYKVFDEGVEHNLFCKTESGQTYIGQVWPGLTAFPDFVKEETRRWWGRLNAEHVKSGLAGIWNDMNEPETGGVSPYRMRFDRDGANYNHERYHNTYATLMAMGTYDGLKTAMPGLRTFILSRAGSPGIQRYAINWTGDNYADYKNLAMSVYMNCNLGLSGQGFVGGDIGGFAANTNAELISRWYEYAVFQPFMRNHNTKGQIDQYPWSFDQTTEEIIKTNIELRYKLLPYLYTAQMDFNNSIKPLQRPLVFDYQNDRHCWNNKSEFLCGPDLLIAPVTAEKVTNRSLYLPQGTWVDFYTNEEISGGREVTLAAPIERIPVLVKSGAVIPLAPVRQSTMLPSSNEMTLKVYVPSCDKVYESSLYEDDGLTDNYINGDYRKYNFRCSRFGNEVILDVQISGKGYSGENAKVFNIEFIHNGKIMTRSIQNNAFENFSTSLKL